MDINTTYIKWLFDLATDPRLYRQKNLVSLILDFLDGELAVAYTKAVLDESCTRRTAAGVLLMAENFLPDCPGASSTIKRIESPLQWEMAIKSMYKIPEEFKLVCYYQNHSGDYLLSIWARDGKEVIVLGIIDGSPLSKQIDEIIKIDPKAIVQTGL